MAKLIIASLVLMVLVSVLAVPYGAQRSQHHDNEHGEVLNRGHNNQNNGQGEGLNHGHSNQHHVDDFGHNGNGGGSQRGHEEHGRDQHSHNENQGRSFHKPGY